MDVTTAAFNVAHDFDGGVVALAPKIGKNPSTLNQEVAGVGTAKLGLRDAVKMTIQAGDYRILDAFAMQCGRMTMPLPEMLELDGDDCMVALGRASREFAELCGEICGSLNDGRVTDNEHHRIQREGSQLVAAISSLLAVVAVRNLSGKPAAVQEQSLRVA